MAVPDDIQRLVTEVPSPPGEPLPTGASEAEIGDFSTRTGVSVPPVLREWLRFTNGPCVGPGGVYGIRPLRDELDIEQVYRHFPEWRLQNWIPLAGDGCGNHYILAADGSLGEALPIFFFDHEQGDPLRVQYVVASSLWPFLRFLLRRELGDDRWPFDSEFVLATDPDLKTCDKLPWNEYIYHFLAHRRSSSSCKELRERPSVHSVSPW